MPLWSYARARSREGVPSAMSRPPKLWAYAGVWLDPYHPAPLVEGPQPKALQSRARPTTEPRKRACLRRSWRAKAMVGNHD